jgi:alcohol dehydrogenase
MGRHCPGRSVLGIVRHPGAFSEFLTLPEGNLHVIPDSILTEAAVFAEPLAAACGILDQVQMPCGSPIAVLGDGKLGLLVAQVLQATSKAAAISSRSSGWWATPISIRLANTSTLTRS